MGQIVSKGKFMKNQFTAEQILDIIKQNSSQKSECNIKTLNTIDTIDTKHYKTKHYDNSSVFAPGVVDAHDGVKHSPSLALPSVGLASLPSSPCSDAVALPQREEEVIPQANSGPPEITYMSVSLKNPNTARRTLNVDFRTANTPPGVFNKLVFNLTDRYREFFSNIEEANRTDWEYQQCWEHYHSLATKTRWLGKGRPRGKFTKTGKHVNQKIKLGISAVLEQTREGYLADFWIDGIHKQVLLTAVENKTYPFRYDSKTTMEKTEYLPRGGWL